MGDMKRLLNSFLSEHQEKFIEFTKEQYVDYDDTVKALEFTQEVAANANAAILLQERQSAMEDLVKKVSGIELGVSTYLWPMTYDL